MSHASSPLPEFSDPPVIEVALSVQFEAIKGLHVTQLGLLWSEFRGAFPRVEEHPPLDPVIERFGVKPSNIRPSIQLQMLEAPPMPRCWFLNEAGTELIQVQSDRFIHNWRKTAADQEYRRFPRLREAFESELKKVQGFLDREKLGDIFPNQCEVTYVNHIIAGKGWMRFGELGKVLTVFNDRYSDGFLATPEDARVAIRYEITNAQREPTGRLHIDVQPAYRVSDGTPMLVLSLTARVRPDGNGLEGALKSLDIGREWVVRGFASITTPEMHKLWGRRDANRTP